MVVELSDDLSNLTRVIPFSAISHLSQIHELLVHRLQKKGRSNNAVRSALHERLRVDQPLTVSIFSLVPLVSCELRGGEITLFSSTGASTVVLSPVRAAVDPAFRLIRFLST